MASETMSAFFDPLMNATESNLGSVILWEGGTGEPDQSTTRCRRYDEQDIVALPELVVIEQYDT